jgi:hypothetical protein
MRRLIFFINTLLLLSNATLSLASVPLGSARKGTDGHYDMYGCMHSNDYYIANFGAYQVDPKQLATTKKLPVAECINLPKTGKTQIAIDMLDQDVRKKKVALKIFQSNQQVLTEIPMNFSKGGVITTEVDFKAPGNYDAVIYVEDHDLKMPLDLTALHIPLTVALAIESPAAKSTMTGLFVTLGIMLLVSAIFIPRLLKSHTSS